MRAGSGDLGHPDRRLQRSPRWRPFSFSGRRYGHTSAVPLVYLAGSPRLFELLDAFAVPCRLSEVLGRAQSDGGDDERRFWAALTTVGILADADDPDPVHALMPSQDAHRAMYLYPTSSCNLRCVYCYATSGPGAGPRLSVQHALVAVDDFFDGLGPSVRSVTLRFHGGGEPTTNLSVMRVAAQRFRDRADALGLRSQVVTITNGTFGPAVRDFLVEAGWLLTVSYDGPRQDDQRPTAAARGSRSRVVANLRALVAAGLPVQVRATLTRDALPTMRALVDDAASIGLRHVQVEPASVVGRGATMSDGAPDPLEFADAFLDAFRYALRHGVALTTSAWSHTRVGNGSYCGAVQGARALTPDGAVSACTEVADGSDAEDPFVVGRLDVAGRRLEVWPVRDARLSSRTGYNLPGCRTCAMVDTCAGGCASRARTATGDVLSRDESHCVASRRINLALMADLADGRLLPDSGWQPIEIDLPASRSSVPGVSGRLVAMVPPFARAAWNADPDRRPVFVEAPVAKPFFHPPS